MSSRKPPTNAGDWDDFDIPTWDDSVPSAPRKGLARAAQRPSSGSQRAQSDPLYDDYDEPGYSSQPPKRLSSRVPSRTTRPSQDPYRDPYSEFADSYAGDSYLPETQYPSREPTRTAVPSQYDLYADPAVDSGWADPAVYDGAPPSRRGRTSRQRTRTTRPSVSISRPAISDGALTGIAATATLSLLLMAGVVWWGLGDLGDLIPWHLNASGDVDQWASNTALWRIPFGVFMTLVIGFVLGAFLWKRDRFAARFIVSSLCIVQVLAWVAVIDQLW